MIRTVLAINLLQIALMQLVWAQETESLEEFCTKNIKGTVPLISAEELLAEMDGGSKIVLMDVREKSEFNISHLPNAQIGLVAKGNLRSKILKEIPKDSEIRLYASVGLRSEMIGEQLLEAGYPNVKNLYGGIFTWANQGHPLVDKEEKPTNFLHGFHPSWFLWIDIHQSKPVMK